MKLSLSVVIACLVLLLFWLVYIMAAQVAPVAAQGPVSPTPAPTPNPIDRNNQQADQWEAVSNQAIGAAYAAIGQAQAAIGQAQAGLAAAQQATEFERQAKLAAQQGQIQAATDAAHNSALSALKAIDLAGASIASAESARNGANQAIWALAEDKATIGSQAEMIVQLSKDNGRQAARLAYLEPYALNTYQQMVIGWAVAGVLGFVLIGVLLITLIIIAIGRRNKWPIFKYGFSRGIVWAREPIAERTKQ